MKRDTEQACSVAGHDSEPGQVYTRNEVDEGEDPQQSYESRQPLEQAGYCPGHTR